VNRTALEHIIRAAGDVLQERTVVIVGSQAILASYPESHLPPAATRSTEADVLPLDDSDGHKADMIDGTLGELSYFDELHGYHGDGVSLETSVLPGRWEDRLIPYSNEQSNGVTGLCLEKHDLCIAKLVAFRDKDLQFVRALVAADLVDVEVLQDRLKITVIPEQTRSRIQGFLTSARRARST
jgi:hypothetical protein